MRNYPKNGLKFSGVAFFVGMISALAFQSRQAEADVLIGLLDTGVNIQSLPKNTRIAPGGWNFVDKNSNTKDTSASGHGTAMASILGTESGGAGIVVIRTESFTTPSSPQVATAGIEYATAGTNSGGNIRIIVRPNAAHNPASKPTAVIAAANAGKLLVMQAGNQGGAEPVGDAALASLLGGRGLVTGALTPSGKLLGFSNKAGSQADWYVTAPGGSSYYPGIGTSIAAAKTAALAARVMGASPHLTAKEVAEIIRVTATDQGAPGVDKIYGWGSINSEKALLPIGTIAAPVDDAEDNLDAPVDDAEDNEDDADSNDSGESSSGGAGVALAALVVGGVGYALLGNNPDLKETLVLDDYGRSFELDLETRVTVRDPGPSAQSVLEELGTEQVEETLIQRSDLQMTASYTTNSADALWLAGSDDSINPDQTVRMSMSAIHSDGTLYAFGVNQSLSGFHNSLSGWDGTAELSSTFQTNAFSTPLSGFTDLGYHGGLGFVSQAGWQGGLSFAFTDEQTQYGLKSDNSAVHAGFQQNRWSVGFRMDFLEEDGNLLGGASDGALSVSRARTVSGALRGHLDLDQRWSVVGKYTEALTWTDDHHASLVRDFSEIQSNSWGIGLVGRNLLNAGDAFGAAWSQPLRTRAGDARVSVPYWNSALGGIDFKVARTSLVPDGIEQTFELFYRMPLTSHTRLITYLVHREQPLHRRGNSARTSLVGALQFDFSSH
jgi:hypothetical protein